MEVWWRRLFPGVAILLVMLLSACATQTRALLQDNATNLPRSVELSSVPFFPQERYQCGPATLAMALGAAGISVVPDALVSQVYVPQRAGSLQPEMLAAGRRNGAVSMLIPSRLDALLTEVAAGNPVAVLQNLSIPLSPLWHYALVIGYDLDAGDIILRSGTTKRLVMPLSTFEHTWARSNYWGMVNLPAGRLPATVDEVKVVDALVAFEKSADAKTAQIAYEAATLRWPSNLSLLLGRGNTAYAVGDRVTAVAAFRQAAEKHPDNAPAFNNLATVLAELGEIEQAYTAAKTAVSLGGAWHDASYATLQSIEAMRRTPREH